MKRSGNLKIPLAFSLQIQLKSTWHGNINSLRQVKKLLSCFSFPRVNSRVGWEKEQELIQDVDLTNLLLQKNCHLSVIRNIKSSRAANNFPHLFLFHCDSFTFRVERRELRTLLKCHQNQLFSTIQEIARIVKFKDTK